MDVIRYAVTSLLLVWSFHYIFCWSLIKSGTCPHTYVEPLAGGQCFATKREWGGSGQKEVWRWNCLSCECHVSAMFHLSLVYPPDVLIWSSSFQLCPHTYPLNPQDLGNVNCTVFAHRQDYNRPRNLWLMCHALNEKWGMELSVNKRDDIMCQGRWKVSQFVLPCYISISCLISYIGK